MRYNIHKLVILFLIKIIKGYQSFISPMLGNNCRFFPTCSNYCEEALLKHGLIKGSQLSVKRILKCHPWGGEGCDPIPDE